MKIKEITNASSLMSKYVEIREEQRKSQKNYGITKWSARSDYPMFYSLIKFFEPDNVFECGTNSGMSGMAWALGLEELQKGTVFTWDIRDYDCSYLGTNLEPRIISYKGDFSANVGKILSKFQGTKKLIFIDGNHTLEGCKKDFDAISSFLQLRDVVVFHDSKRKGVKLAIKEIKKGFKFSRQLSLNSKAGMEVFLV